MHLLLLSSMALHLEYLEHIIFLAFGLQMVLSLLSILSTFTLQNAIPTKHRPSLLMMTLTSMIVIAMVCLMISDVTCDL